MERKEEISFEEFEKSAIKGLYEKKSFMGQNGVFTPLIKHFLEEIYALTLSPAQMSEITDKIIPELEQWQSRPLEPVYAIVWFDAIHYKVREQGAIKSKAVYNVLAVNMEGERELLGIYVSESESARFWLSVMEDLQLRGVG